MKFDAAIYEAAKGAVRKEYDDNRGTIILVSNAYGSRDDDSIELAFDPPLVATLIESHEEDMFRTVDEFMDPYFNIRALEDRAELTGVQSLWVYGTSHNLKTGETDGSTFEPTGTPVITTPSFIDWSNA